MPPKKRTRRHSSSTTAAIALVAELQPRPAPAPISPSSAAALLDHIGNTTLASMRDISDGKNIVAAPSSSVAAAQSYGHHLPPPLPEYHTIVGYDLPGVRPARALPGFVVVARRPLKPRAPFPSAPLPQQRSLASRSDKRSSYERPPFGPRHASSALSAIPSKQCICLLLRARPRKRYNWPPPDPTNIASPPPNPQIDIQINPQIDNNQPPKPVSRAAQTRPQVIGLTASNENEKEKESEGNGEPPGGLGRSWRNRKPAGRGGLGRELLRF